MNFCTPGKEGFWLGPFDGARIPAFARTLPNVGVVQPDLVPGPVDPSTRLHMQEFLQQKVFLPKTVAPVHRMTTYPTKER